MYGSCSGSCSKICFNPSCRVSELESWRKGWELRSGEIAELCDSCGSAYEEMRFCEVFHSDTAGWRSCESCGKIMHCGCVASVHMFILLDTGGVECMSCASRSSIIMASNQIWPPSIFLPLYLPESMVDLSGKNYNQITGPNSGSEQWQQPPTLWDAANSGSELYPWMSNPGVDRSNTFALSGDFSSAFAQEKKNIKDLPEEEKIKSLQDSGHLTGGTDPLYPRRGAITNSNTFSS